MLAGSNGDRGCLRLPSSGGGFSGGLESSAGLGSPFTGKPRMKNQTPNVRDCAALFGSGFWRSRLRMIGQLS